MFTVYDTDNNELSKVEEPDPSLSYTYADYLKWNFEERLELIRGRIFKMSPAPSPLHQRVTGNIHATIHQFLKKKKCVVYQAPFDVRLPTKNRNKDNQVTTVVQPDVCIICDETKIDERGCNGAPDLVAETLSPGNSIKEVNLKFELYEKSGVKEYWIIYPAEETVAVFLLDEKGKYNGATLYVHGDKILSEAVPGLKIKVNDIFTK
jgi:Uma2 family endonuclease